MNTLAPFVIIYLLGIATPIFLVSLLPTVSKNDGDRSFLNLLLAGVFVLIIFVFYLWIQAVTT